MRIKFWSGFAALCLAFFSSWAGAVGTLQPLTLCVDKSSATLDTIADDGPTTCTVSATNKASVKVNFLHNNRPLRPSTNYTGVNKAIIVITAVDHHPDAILGPSPEIDATAVYEQIQSEIGSNTWLVAPQFRSEPVDGVNGFLLWSNRATGELGYAAGDVSETPGQVEISSFSVVDHLVQRMKAWAPDIKEFILVGFGSGAEFLNRYSIGTGIDDPSSENYVQGVSVRYLIVSPRRYMYLNTTRYMKVPAEQIPRKRDPIDPLCANTYNNYPYGVAGLQDHYMNLSDAGFRKRVANKRRLFLIGDTDRTKTNIDSDLQDTPAARCPSDQQGGSHYTRALSYMHHLRVERVNIAPVAGQTDLVSTSLNAGFCVIQGEKRDSKKLMESEAARRYWKDNVIDCTLDDPPDCTPGTTNCPPDNNTERRRK